MVGSEACSVWGSLLGQDDESELWAKKVMFSLVQVCGPCYNGIIFHPASGLPNKGFTNWTQEDILVQVWVAGSGINGRILTRNTTAIDRSHTMPY